MFEDEEERVVESLPRQKNKIISGVGWTVRGSTTIVSTFLTYFGAFGNLEAVKINSIPAEAVISALVLPGSVYTTLFFWAKVAQDNTEFCLESAARRCSSRSDEEQRPLIRRDHAVHKLSNCKKCAFMVFSPLNWVSILSDSYFVMRESLTDPALFNMQEANKAVIITSVISALLSSVFNASSESAAIWKDIQQEDDRPAKCLLPRYLLATFGAINENIKFCLPLYIELDRILNSKAASATITGIVAPFSTLQTFIFQSGVMFKNTPAEKAIDKRIARIGRNKRIAIVVAIGITQFLVSFTMYSFYARQVCQDVLIGRLGANMSEKLISGVSYSCGLTLYGLGLFSETIGASREILKADDDNIDEIDLETLGPRYSEL